MAASMVQDGESIALDASTTALAVARHLKRMEPRTQLTVITNGLRIASELAGTPGVTVVMPGGFVRGEALSLVGQLGDPVFEKVNLQKAFLGAAGFTLEAGLSDATEEEAQIKRSMTRSAREVIAIVDSSKWERVALATFCRFEAITQVITDELAPPAMVASLRARGIEVHEVAAGDADGHSGHQQGRLA
jgi:DeoR/GlpR family transcriptional regulator of sugar metabolism